MADKHTLKPIANSVTLDWSECEAYRVGEPLRSFQHLGWLSTDVLIQGLLVVAFYMRR